MNQFQNPKHPNAHFCLLISRERARLSANYPLQGLLMQTSECSQARIRDKVHPNRGLENSNEEPKHFSQS